MMFFAGAICYKKKWLDHITDKMGKISVSIGLSMTVIIYAQHILPDMIINTLWRYFATYETIMTVSILIGLLYLFRKIKIENKFTELLAQNAFGAYIIHILFVVLAQISVSYINTNASIKFIISYVLAVLCSFIAAYLLRKVFFVRRFV
jgi:hypothetical protein